MPKDGWYESQPSPYVPPGPNKYIIRLITKQSQNLWWQYFCSNKICLLVLFNWTFKKDQSKEWWRVKWTGISYVYNNSWVVVTKATCVQQTKMIRVSYLQGSNSYDDKIAIEIGLLLKVDNIILLLLSCVRADVCGSWTFSTPWHSWPKLLFFQFIFCNL